jgi:multicomponent Na+:H+ antiporter subunit F
MIQIAAQYALVVFGLAMLLTLVRVVRGSVPHRAVALDLITTLALCVTGLLAIVYRKAWFLDVAIVLSLVAFLVTLAFARYVEENT